MEIFRILFYEPTFNLLMYFYSIVGNLGIAILLIAVVSRLITWPLTRKQMKNAEKNKEFQKEVNAIKKKYRKNQEKQAQEMAKIQAKYLPGQLGGCLNMILALILLVQVRHVIINLVDQGVHAFNQVAYFESMKLPEDSITISSPNLDTGIHVLEYEIVADGSRLQKQFIFAITDSENHNKLTGELQDKLAKISNEDKTQIETEAKNSSISLYIEEFKDFKKDKPIVLEDLDQITAHIRPPSNLAINYEQSVVTLNGEIIGSEQLEISKGVPLNFTFMGADLSKVATDFGFSDPVKVAPYVLIALLVGITQIFASKVQMRMNPAMMVDKDKEDKDKSVKESSKKKKKEKDEKNKKPEDMNFGEVFAQSSKQMTYVFPMMTVVWSLGFFGAFFPTGVSLFWTGQNSFVIIQELITNREKVLEKIKNYKENLLTKNNKKGDKKGN